MMTKLRPIYYIMGEQAIDKVVSSRHAVTQTRYKAEQFTSVNDSLQSALLKNATLHFLHCFAVIVCQDIIVVAVNSTIDV
jgi:hypothetical protein